jgi:hypothetical protein
MTTTSPSRRCTATRQDGTPCRAWAVRGSQPPLCSAHGGLAPAGATPGKGQAGKHDRSTGAGPGEVTITDAINALVRKMELIDALLADDDLALTTQERIRLLGLATQAASRLGRLLRDRRALAGDAADGLLGAVAQVLDEIGTELGVEL